MFKAAAGVVVGYIVMALVVFVALTVAYLAMGGERAFKPASWDISTLWLAVSICVSIVAAIVGGVVCAVVAGRTSKAPTILAVVVIVLGLAMAIPAFTSQPAAEARTSTPALMDAMTRARPPQALPLINTVIGAVGVLLGARLGGSGRR